MAKHTIELEEYMDKLFFEKYAEDQTEEIWWLN